MKINNENLTIIEPYEVIEAGGNFRLHQYRLFQYIIGETFVSDKLEIGEFYKISLNNYAKFFGLTQTAAYHAFTDAMTNGLPTMDMLENIFTEGAKPTKRRRFYIYNTYTYDTDTGEIKIKLADELVILYNRLGEEGRGYAKYVLEHTRRMKSINSIRLFRLLNKWRMVRYVKYNLEEFRYKMGFTGEEYVRWDNLNSKVIQPALREIHREAYLKVSMEVIKEGRKIVGVKFYIKSVKSGQQQQHLV
jgi:plasmid replication initiation protein